jgi:hypothetical protein
MREIRQSGSEGGGTGTTGPPYPYHDFPRCERHSRGWSAFAGHDGGVDRALVTGLFRGTTYVASRVFQNAGQMPG